MTREELNKMIEDEVSALVGSTIEEPQKATEAKSVAPKKLTAELSEEELDSVLFYGGNKPEYE